MNKQLSLFVVFLAFIICSASAQDNSNLNQLKDKAQKALQNKQADSARYYLNQLLRDYPQNKMLVARSYNNLGMIDIQEGFTTRGLEYLNIAINAYEKSNNDTLLAISLYNTGRSYKMLAQYDKAAELLIRALKIFEENDKTIHTSRTYNVLGNLYRETNDFEIALDYQEKACQIAEKVGDSSRLAQFLNNKGKTYSEMEFFQQAIEAFEEALKIKTQLNLSTIAYTYYNIGEAEFLRANVNEAVTYFKLALEGHEKTNNKRELAYTANYLGKAYTALKSWDQAVHYLQKAQVTALELEMNDLLLTNYESLYQLYDSTNSVDQALANHKRYLNKYKEVVNLNKQKTINELQIKYEVEKKEHENKLLNQKAELDQLKITQQADLIWFWRLVTVVTLILITFTIIVGRKYYKLFEKEKLLAKREKDLNIEQHHRIKNHLQVLAGLLSFQQRKIQDHTAKEVIRESSNRVGVIKMLHQHFYQDEIYDGTSIQMHSYLKEIIENLIILFDKKEIQRTLQINPVALSPDKALPLGLICNEIISNSLKYGLNNSPDSTLEVSLDKKQDVITLMISDNGGGFTDNDINSDSIGLDLIRQLVNQIDGRIDKSIRSGTQYLISFKDKKGRN